MTFQPKSCFQECLAFINLVFLHIMWHFPSLQL